MIEDTIEFVPVKFDLRELTVTESNILKYLLDKRDSLMKNSKENEKLHFLFRHEACLIHTIIVDINSIIEERKKIV